MRVSNLVLSGFSKHAVSLGLVAALVLASAPASAAKPGGGGSPDPCIGANLHGFPSFVFTKNITVSGAKVPTWGIFVADATAKCQKQVGTYPFSRTVNLRYDSATASGLLVHDSNGYQLVAATMSVSFNADGSPVVQASAFQTLVAAADLPDPQLAGWGPLQYIGSPAVSPDGLTILFKGSDATSGDDAVFWTCPLDSAAPAVVALTCSVVHRAPSGPGATWGARAGTIYVTQTAVSGSGNSLYRLTLPTTASPAGSFEEIWSRGTLFNYTKATLISGIEQVAVYEANPLSRCSKVFVINADSCLGNFCAVSNGAGHPSRSLAWLPDGRVAGEGQTVPDRKGMCAAAGTIVSFDPFDTNGAFTTLTQGFYPDGAGGG